MTRRLGLVCVIWCAVILALVLTGCEKQDSDPTLETLKGQVSEFRGLEFLEPVNEAFLTRDELRQRVMDDFFQDYSEQDVRDDVLLLAAFEFAEPDLDLYNLYVDLHTEQTLGFYDSETDELYVIKDEQAFGAMEQSTFSHEYVHVLQVPPSVAASNAPPPILTSTAVTAVSSDAVPVTTTVL